jgi:hypothetical protein
MKTLSRLWSFLLGVVVGAALLYTAMHYHLVRSNDGFHLIAKSPARLSQSFVDIRSFGASDWVGHPQLASALVQAGKQHLIGEGTASAVEQSVNQSLPDGYKR